MADKPTYEQLEERIRQLEGQAEKSRRAEAEVRENEDRYRSLVENSLSAIILYRQQEILFANQPFSDIFGYDPEEMKRISVDDLMAPEVAAEVADRRRRRLAGEIEDTAVYESKGIRKNGEIFEMEISVCIVPYQGAPCCMASLSDISRRKQVEVQIRESEAKFRNLFELSPQAVALAEVETGKIIDANETFFKLTRFSKEEIIGRTTTEIGLYSRQDRERFLRRLRDEGEVQGLEMDFRIKDGSIIHTLMFSKIIRISTQPLLLTLLFDITDRKQLEVQLRHAQKMEAVGTLAGGIAHDFNNLLMAIQGNVSLILSGMNPSDSRYERLKNIERLIASGGRLTRQLLGYAVNQKNDTRGVDLNRTIEQTLATFFVGEKGLVIQKKLKAWCTTVEADRGQIERVLLNLFTNAVEAMPAGGVLLVQTENIPHIRIKNKPYRPNPGTYVVLTVADTGRGIDPRTLPRVFEPFFTTKKMGSGKGLGLASVYGIVKAYGGYIDVESATGRGTTFTIYLPATEKRAEPIGRGPTPVVPMD